MGTHVIKTWSSTQVSLALSSGEAEYYGVVRGAGIGLGQQALFKDAGLELPLRVWTDSSAAMGTSSRQGLGKLRHLECHSLWIQQRLRRKEFELRKVPGEENPGDLFTKHLDSAKKLEQLLGMFSCEFRSGRAASAPNLKKAATADRPRPQDALFVGMVLPHLTPRAELDKRFPSIKAPPEHYGEEDTPPEEELGDPVPRLQRPSPKQHAAPGTSRRRARAAKGAEAAHLASQAGDIQVLLAAEPAEPSGAESDARFSAVLSPTLLFEDKGVCVSSLTAAGRNLCFKAAGAVGRCLDMRHRRNNNNKNKKQDGWQGRDVDESALVDQMPRSVVLDSAADGRIDYAGSALRYTKVEAGSALKYTKDETGSALSSSSHEENSATGDVLVGLRLPHRARQMLCSYLDQATQTSLFV